MGSFRSWPHHTDGALPGSNVHATGVAGGVVALIGLAQRRRA
ncbi:hypothetical protein [Pseudomonas typographi]|nr:hypothetical protein [Pseudomonas typographi]